MLISTRETKTETSSAINLFRSHRTSTSNNTTSAGKEPIPSIANHAVFKSRPLSKGQLAIITNQTSHKEKVI